MTKQATRLYDDLVKLTWFFSDQCCTGSDVQPLSMVDFLALRLINRRHHCAIQSVGKALGMTKSGATRVVKRLEKQQLIAISTDPDDARIRCLCLTQEGREVVEKIVSTQTSHLQDLLNRMGEEKSQQLSSGLEALMDELCS